MSRNQPRVPFVGHNSADNSSGPIVSAHRGFSGQFPENTLSSLAAAIPLADFVEIDLRSTADHHVIVMHDRTLRRTTDVAAVFPDRADDPVDTFTLDEIRRLDAGSWHSEQHQGTLVPTLREALDLLTDTDCGALLELKEDIEELVRDELAVFLQEVPGFRVALASVDVDRARRMYDLMPQLPIGVLFLDQETITDDDIADYTSFASLLAFRTDNVSAALVDRVHAADARLTHNTNTRQWMDESCAAGADGTMTDYPDRKRESIDDQEITIIEAEDHADTTQVRMDNGGLHFKLSGGAGLRQAEADGRLEIPFTIGDSASWTLECALVHGPTGATFDLFVDDLAVADGHDAYARSPARHTLALGPIDLDAGDHLLSLRGTGSSPRSRGRDIMLDAVMIRPAELDRK